MGAWHVEATGTLCIAARRGICRCAEGWWGAATLQGTETKGRNHPRVQEPQGRNAVGPCDRPAS